MDSLFHFIFPLMAALAARIHVKHGLPTLIGLSLATVLLDLDVFFIHRATLHNVFVALVLPLIFFALALKYEKRGNYFKIVALALLLFLVSHPILDMFTEGGVQLFYPLSTQAYSFVGTGISVRLPVGDSYLIGGTGIGLAAYFALVLLILFIEDFLKLIKKEPAGRAIYDTIKREQKKIKKEI